MVGNVGIVKVEPEADPLGQALELLDVTPDARFTSLVKGLDPELLDIGLAFEAHLFLDFDFDRQALRVPAAARTDHMFAAQTMVAHDDILRDTRLDMVYTRPPVRRRRPFEEDERPRTIAALERLAHDIVGTPPGLDFEFERRK